MNICPNVETSRPIYGREPLSWQPKTHGSRAIGIETLRKNNARAIELAQDVVAFAGTSREYHKNIA